MKGIEALHVRQYTIRLAATTVYLDEKQLTNFGNWSHPSETCYVLLLKSTTDPNNDSQIFTQNFLAATGLTLNDVIIEAKYGPMNLANATDSPWF